MKPSSPSPKSNHKKPALSNYAMYTNMAIQMAVVIAAGVGGGYLLDKAINTIPVFVIIGSLAGVALALYLVIKTAIKKD